MFRIDRGALMSTEVKNEDTDEKDELPKHPEEAQVWLSPLTAPAPTSKEGVHGGGDGSDDMSPNTHERVIGDVNRGL